MIRNILNLLKQLTKQYKLEANTTIKFEFHFHSFVWLVDRDCEDFEK